MKPLILIINYLKANAPHLLEEKNYQLLRSYMRTNYPDHKESSYLREARKYRHQPTELEKKQHNSLPGINDWLSK